jgi:hypothetical protein
MSWIQDNTIISMIISRAYSQQMTLADISVIKLADLTFKKTQIFISKSTLNSLILV